MHDDRTYYRAHAATEYTLAAQAADPVLRHIHTEIANAYTQLAESAPRRRPAWLRLVT